VETLVKKFNQEIQEDKTTVTLSLPKHLIEKKDKLTEFLSTKIDIKRNLKGKGHVSIFFKTDDDLKRILELMNI
jgi:hypothetical protein